MSIGLARFLRLWQFSIARKHSQGPSCARKQEPKWSAACSATASPLSRLPSFGPGSGTCRPRCAPTKAARNRHRRRRCHFAAAAAAPLLPANTPPQLPTSSRQAADVEAFLARRQAASAQQQARTAWLLAHQQLDQEAADCEAALLDCLSASSAQPRLLQLLLAPTETDQDAEPAPAAPPAAVSGAVALAGEAACLLHAGGAPPAASLAALQQRVAAALQGLQAHVAALQGSATELGCAMQQVQRRVQAPAPQDGSLSDQLAQLCAAHPLAPPVCAAQLRAEAAELEAQHAQQREQRRAAWRAFLAATRRQADCGGAAQGEAPAGDGSQVAGEPSACPSSSDSSDTASWRGADSIAGCTPDGWSADEQAVFLAARRAAPGATAGTALARQLAVLLPARSADQVAAHERWHKEATRLRAAAQQADAGAKQAGRAFLAAAAALLAEAEAGCLEQAGAALWQLQVDATALRAGDSLQQQREERAEAAAASEAVQLEAAAAAAAQQAERHRRELDWRARMKQLLAQHREAAAAEAAAAKAAEQAAAAAAAREAAAAVAAGRQRVAHRAAQAEARQASRAQQEVQQQQERERRRAALNALAARVAPAARRDAARATGPTRSSAAAVGAEEQRRGLFARALGFTADQLLADQRFKGGAARECGGVGRGC